jgi:hypothetical protein
MLPNSPYKDTFSRKDNRLHLGFDYKGKILQKTTSNQLWGVSETLDTVLINIDKVVYSWIEAAKKIKVWRNLALDKHENKFN